MASSSTDIIDSWKENFNPKEKLVKSEDADKGNHAFLDIETAPCIWLGVRGSNYNKKILASIPTGRRSGILVPEPDNEFDPLAVAVHVRNQRIGYLSSRLAANCHSTIGMMRNLGHPMSIPVEISREHYIDFNNDTGSEIKRIIYGAHACVPSLKRLDEFVPRKVIYASLWQLWDQLPKDTRDQIVADRYHLTQSTGEQILENRHLAPDYFFPRRFDVSFQDSVFNRFLQSVRIENKKAMDKGRLIRNKKIYDLYLSGTSNKDISHRFGLKPGTISGIIRKLKSEDSLE